MTSTVDDGDKPHCVPEAHKPSIKHQPDIACPDTSPIKPKRHVSFETYDDDKETNAIDRRETPFVWDLPRDGSPEEEGRSDVGISITLDSKRASSQPDVAYHVQAFASTSSLPTTIAINAATDAQATSTDISSHTVEDAAIDGHDDIQQKSDHISSRVSAFLPTLPDHLEDENVPATRVPTEQTSDHAREKIDVSPFAFDIPEVEQDVEDEEEQYPDVQPELSTEPLESLEQLEPLELLPAAEDTAVKFDAGSDKVREYDDVRDLEDQSAQVSIKVDDVDGATLEPRRSLREIVYISLHEEKQVKGTDDAETDKEHGDAEIQTKSPVAEYELPADDNRQKSIIDRFIPVPPVASESGIVMTLSDYDDGNFSKLRTSKAEQKSEGQSSDSNDDIAAFFSTETDADDKMRPRMTVSGTTKVANVKRTSDANALMAKRRRKSTFVEEMRTENKRKVAPVHPLKKATPVPEEEPPPTENEPEAVAESIDENVVAVKPVVDEVVPQRQRSTTLIVALNKDTECEFDTGDDMHVASRPTSRSFRYIVSPHAQYAANRSQTKESTLQPSRCKPPPTAGVDKEKSPISLRPAAEPVKSTHTDHTSTEQQAADDSDTPPPSQAVKTSPDSVSADQQLSPVTEPSSAFAGTPPHKKPSAGQAIQMTLADWDREDEDVVKKDSWQKWNWDIMPSSVPTSRQPSPLDLGLHQRSMNDDVITISLDSYDRHDDNNQSYPIFISGRVMNQVKKFSSASHDSDAERDASSDPVDSLESPDSGVETQDRHSAVPTEPLDSSKSQDAGDGTRDTHSAVPAEPVDSSESEDSDAETEDKYYDMPAKQFQSSLQPTDSNDIDDASVQTKHQDPDTSGTTEIKTPPEHNAAASDISESHTEQVTPRSVAAFNEKVKKSTFRVDIDDFEALTSSSQKSDVDETPDTVNEEGR